MFLSRGFLMAALGGLCGTTKAMVGLPKSGCWSKKLPTITSRLFVSTTASEASERTEPQGAAEELLFNPLGPPTHLARLKVGESCTIPLLEEEKEVVSITCLSRTPDIFLVPNFVKQPEKLIALARAKGLQPAQTRKSDPNTIRKNSYLTWLSSSDDDDLVRTDLSKRLMVHEALNNDNDEYVIVEDLQLAFYEPQGHFDLHHDGFHRIVTVLHYLNGVGGTYFPLAQTTNDNHNAATPISMVHQQDGSLCCSDGGFQLGKDGLLVVGTEGPAAYFDEDSDSRTGNHVDENAAVVKIKAGDSIVFYNCNSNLKAEDGHKEWRSIHQGLPVTAAKGKWIATNWFRSEDLTGPFARLYRERLMDLARPCGENV